MECPVVSLSIFVYITEQTKIVWIVFFVSEDGFPTGILKNGNFVKVYRKKEILLEKFSVEWNLQSWNFDNKRFRLPEIKSSKKTPNQELQKIKDFPLKTDSITKLTPIRIDRDSNNGKSSKFNPLHTQSTLPSPP